MIIGTKEIAMEQNLQDGFIIMEAGTISMEMVRWQQDS